MGRTGNRPALRRAGLSSCASPPWCSGRSPAEPYPPAEARRLGQALPEWGLELARHRRSSWDAAALPVSVSRTV